MRTKDQGLRTASQRSRLAMEERIPQISSASRASVAIRKASPSRLARNPGPKGLIGKCRKQEVCQRDAGRRNNGSPPRVVMLDEAMDAQLPSLPTTFPAPTPPRSLPDLSSVDPTLDLPD